MRAHADADPIQRLRSALIQDSAIYIYLNSARSDSDVIKLADMIDEAYKIDARKDEESYRAYNERKSSAFSVFNARDWDSKRQAILDQRATAVFRDFLQSLNAQNEPLLLSSIVNKPSEAMYMDPSLTKLWESRFPGISSKLNHMSFGNPDKSYMWLYEISLGQFGNQTLINYERYKRNVKLFSEKYQEDREFNILQAQFNAVCAKFSNQVLATEIVGDAVIFKNELDNATYVVQCLPQPNDRGIYAIGRPFSIQGRR